MKTHLKIIISKSSGNCSADTLRSLPLNGYHLHLSIFTATVMTVSDLDSPYAVASTTFPKAPDPSVFPEDK